MIGLDDTVFYTENARNPKNTVLGTFTKPDVKFAGDVVTVNRANPANNNIAVIGGSGSGKTRSFVIPEILRCANRNESFVCVCTESFLCIDQYDETKNYLAANGYDIRIVNYFDGEDYMSAKITFGNRISKALDPGNSPRDYVDRTEEYACALIERKTAVFVLINKLNYGNVYVGSKFCSQLYGDLIKLKGRYILQKDTVPVNFIFDEFCDLHRLDPVPEYQSFAQMLKQGLCIGIRTYLTIGSVSDIRMRYERDWKEILEHCRITVFFGCNDDVTAEYISELSGEYTKDEVLKLPAEKLIVIARKCIPISLYKLDFSCYLFS